MGRRSHEDQRRHDRGYVRRSVHDAGRSPRDHGRDGEVGAGGGHQAHRVRDVGDRLAVGKALRVFGDGFQASKVIGGKRYWRLPVMEGEFLVEETFGMLKGVGGGNFLILAADADAALAAAEAAVDAMTSLPGVILPFPGGVVRSGSKVGSKRYKNMVATTNDPFDPTLRAITQSQLPAGVNSVLEIVLDGTDASSIAAAMRSGIPAACRPGVKTITAANFGGKLGPHHFHLRKILA